MITVLPLTRPTHHPCAGNLMTIMKARRPPPRRLAGRRTLRYKSAAAQRAPPSSTRNTRSGAIEQAPRSARRLVYPPLPIRQTRRLAFCPGTGDRPLVPHPALSFQLHPRLLAVHSSASIAPDLDPVLPLPLHRPGMRIYTTRYIFPMMMTPPPPQKRTTLTLPALRTLDLPGMPALLPAPLPYSLVRSRLLVHLYCTPNLSSPLRRRPARPGLHVPPYLLHLLHLRPPAPRITDSTPTATTTAAGARPPPHRPRSPARAPTPA
jgi:hypothetical protein